MIALSHKESGVDAAEYKETTPSQDFFGGFLWNTTFQQPRTLTFEAIIAFHDSLMFFGIFIAL